MTVASGSGGGVKGGNWRRMRGVWRMRASTAGSVRTGGEAQREEGAGAEEEASDGGDLEKSEEKNPLDEGGGAADDEHAHRSAGSTPRRAESMWRPHPAHVHSEHVLHLTFRHIVLLVFGFRDACSVFRGRCAGG